MPVKTKAAEQAEHAWIREAVPDYAALFAQGGPVDELAPMVQLNVNGYYMSYLGWIKPDRSLKTVPELRKQLTDSYHRIVTILEEAGVSFWSYPELDLKGKVCKPPAGKPEVYDMEAKIRIELEVQRR